jgi:hypothetical protein
MVSCIKGRTQIVLANGIVREMFKEKEQEAGENYRVMICTPY